MTKAQSSLSAVRRQLAANFGSRGEHVFAQPLVLLEQQLAASDGLDGALVGQLLDQLEDLAEALLRESGWVEIDSKGGPR